MERTFAGAGRGKGGNGQRGRESADQEFRRVSRPVSRFVYQFGTPMEPVFAAAKRAPERVVYAEGEDERVLPAAQTTVAEGIARPLLVGRVDIMAARIQKRSQAQTR